MRKLITSVAAAAFLSVPAHAATVLLDSVTSVSDGYEFSYAGTLDDTEGLRNGSQLVIFDFAGYVDGSVFSPYDRSEEHTSELQSLMRISYAVFCLKKKNT